MDFEGGLKNKIYIGIAHTSRATAQKELADLVQKMILVGFLVGGEAQAMILIGVNSKNKSFPSLFITTEDTKSTES